MYYHCYSLDSLWVDYDWWDNCSTVKSEALASASTYNNGGNDIDIYTTSTWTDHGFYATNLGSYSVLVQATYPTIQQAYVRMNNLIHWSTSNACDFANGYNIEWLVNHEFGHTVGLKHTTGTSVMVENCASTWSTVQTHDDAVLDSKY